MKPSILPPVAMLAELTHRCPLQCPYCSNPLDLLKANREMDTAAWLRLFGEAAGLGVLQAHLSGGEPTLRPDLEEIVACLSSLGIYANLITAGVGTAEQRMEKLARAGLDHVQISFQGARPETTERIGRSPGGHEKKRQTARRVRELGLPLTINAPIHRHNIAETPQFVELALELGAERLEIANVQYAGWALLNRDLLMPNRSAIEKQMRFVEEARLSLTGILNIDFVAPDYFATYPKPCMGGWGRDAFVVAPDGAILPCHAARTIGSLRFERAGARPLADIWKDSAALNVFRGVDWMREPCRSCARRQIDWGGCRCQALAIAGDASAADPACVKSPYHRTMQHLAQQSATEGGEPSLDRPGGFIHRRFGASMRGSKANPSPAG